MMQKYSGKALLGAVIVLAVIFVLGGGFLLFSAPKPPAESVPDIPAETTVSESTALTTTSTTACTTTAITTTETVITTTETTAPPLSAEETLYAQFLREMISQQHRRSQTFITADNDANVGIAAAFVRDFRGTGTPDLLVIRLDKMLESSAAAPVFQWYTLRDDAVVKLDEFECKMIWCEYTIHFAAQKIYVSGSNGDMNFTPDSWECTELAITMQPKGDMTLDEIQQGYIENRPAAMYPKDAELLMDMQLSAQEAAYPAARQYLLLEYSDLARLLEEE